MTYSTNDMSFAALFGIMIGFFLCAFITVNVQTEAEKEITKCEQNLPRNVQCKLTAVPK